MGESDQKYGRVHDLSIDEYIIDDEESAPVETGLNNVQTETWRGRYVELFEFSPIPFLMLSQVGVLEEVNLATCQLLGRGASSLIGQSLRDVVEVDPEFVDLFLARLSTTTDSVSMEVEVTTTMTFRFIGVRVDDHGVEKIRIAIVEFNPKSTERDDARLTNVLLQSTNGFLFYDAEGQLVRMNRPARAALHGKPTQNLTKLLKALGADPDEISFESLKESLQRTNLWRRDFESGKPDVVLRLVANEISDEDLGLYELLVTVTEVNIASASVPGRGEVAVRKLAERIREPMAALNGALELLESVTDETTSQKLKGIAGRNARIVEIAIENLIAMNSAANLGAFEPCAIAKIAEQSSELIGESLGEMGFSFAGDLQAVVSCDRKKMVQAFTNLFRVIIATSGPNDSVNVWIQRSDENVTVKISTTDAAVVPGLGLEESSLFMIEHDFNVAREIVESHGGVVERTQKDGSPVIAVSLRKED